MYQKCLTYRETWIWIAISVCCFLVGITHAQEKNEIDTHDDLAITYSQKIDLDKFRERMSPFLPHSYMKSDLYLIRWLRASNFNIREAEELLRKNLEWRKENRMDSIHSEDFSDIADDYPVFIDTFDKKGQPAITATAGNWDFRRGIVTGKDQRVFRFMIKALDKATNMVREANENGKNITRFSYVLNLDGFNIIQHGCPRCLHIVFNILRTYEQYFPGMIDNIIIINAPPTIRALFGPLVRSAVNGNTIGSVNLKIIGTNKAEWRKFLLKYFDEKQLPVELGGTRTRQ